MFFAAATFTAGAEDLISKALDPGALRRADADPTGEDESYLRRRRGREEAVREARPPQEEAAAAQPEEAAPEAASRVHRGARRGSSGCGAMDAAEPREPRSGEPTSVEAAPEVRVTEVGAGGVVAEAPAADMEPYVLEPETPGNEARQGREQALGRPFARRSGSQRRGPVEGEGGQPTIWLNRSLG